MTSAPDRMFFAPIAAALLLCHFSLKRSFYLSIMLSCSLDIIALMHLAVAVNR
jgi:hypothetical protein